MSPAKDMKKPAGKYEAAMNKPQFVSKPHENHETWSTPPAASDVGKGNVASQCCQAAVVGDSSAGEGYYGGSGMWRRGESYDYVEVRALGTWSCNMELALGSFHFDQMELDSVLVVALY